MASDSTFIISIISIGIVAVASGLVGVFALTRRMTLAADVISHIALPGLGLALLLKINPVIGGAAALIFGAFAACKPEGAALCSSLSRSNQNQTYLPLNPLLKLDYYMICISQCIP